MRTGGRRIFVPIPPLSLYVLRSAILSADGLLGLIRGDAGRMARGGADMMVKALTVLQEKGMDVDVDAGKADEDVRVRIHMV